MTGKCKKIVIVAALFVVSLTLVFVLVSKKPASEEISDKKIYDTYAEKEQNDGKQEQENTAEYGTMTEEILEEEIGIEDVVAMGHVPDL